MFAPLTLAIIAAATCSQQLLRNNSDSSFFQIKIEDDNTFNPKSIINNLLGKVCTQKELATYSNCTFFHDSDLQARSCYVESPSGYFFLTQDYMSNLNIVYSRWD